jgi:hypothetical protein
MFNEMNITSAQYTSSNQDMIVAVIDGVELDVPTSDIGNRHYAEIMRQVEAGELTIAEAD